MSAGRILRRHAARTMAGMIALVLFAVAKATSGNPEPADSEMRFDLVALGAAEKAGDRRLRPVNPRYASIRGWISAVGSGVAMADIDGDRLPNDICLVEPRDDSVTVLPAPATGERYAAFALITPPAGYGDGTTAPMGCLPGDYNEDGLTDLLIYYWGRPPLIHYASAGEMAASRFRPVSLVAAHEAWFTNAALQADVDGDGHLDLLFGNYFPEDAAVLDAAATTGGNMQHSMSRAFNGGRNRLFLHDGRSGTASGFTDHSSALTADMSNGWTLALAAADLDGDLLPELYVANDFGPDRLLVNLSRPGVPRFQLAVGNRTFTTPRSRTLGRDSFKGMGAEFADLNGDGLLDIAVSNIAQEYALLESHFLFINSGRPETLRQGTASFRDESGPRGTARNGWGWDIKTADFNNDGRPEILQALGFMAGEIDRWPELQELATANDDLIDNPAVWAAFSGNSDLSGHQSSRLYSLDQTGVYRDVSQATGLNVPGVWRGIAIGDVDLDGRQDAVISHQWGRSVFLLNRSPSRGAFLSLDLRLPNANGTTRPAVGAIASAVRPGQPPMIGIVDGGNGHSGKRAPIVHFGLGAGDAPVDVLVTWRDARGVRRARARLRAGHHRLVLRSGPA